MIEPLVVAQLTTDAIEAKIVGDEGVVMEVLQQILVEGTSFDALAFLAACLYTINCGLRPGEHIALWPVEVLSSGTVRPITGNDHPGHFLFAAMLASYMQGDALRIRIMWLAAMEGARAGAVGTAISSAASLVKQRRAVLN